MHACERHLGSINAFPNGDVLRSIFIVMQRRIWTTAVNVSFGSPVLVLSR